jgi:hypothetical protein
MADIAPYDGVSNVTAFKPVSIYILAIHLANSSQSRQAVTRH